MTEQRPRLRFFGEVMGLSPLSERIRQTGIVFRGEADVPPTLFGLSSLRQLRPRLAMTLWTGRSWIARKAVITNLFNHTQTPIALGWSVKKTQALDFRGQQLTYDSHNGTDFSIPVGSTVCTAAPGRVVRVVSEYNRGGLKIFIDHGHGLMTCTAHLARSLVEVGQVLKRGEPVALSGYSGLDALVSFPFGVPHIHFNTWLNGEPVDPFGHGSQAALWRSGNGPLPASDDAGEYQASVYDEAKVVEAIAGCITPSARDRLSAIEPLWERAGHLVAEMNYYPTRFPVRVSPYADVHPREPVLDLPLCADQFDGVVFVDV